MQSETEVVKVDALGRALTARRRREALLDEFERSGMSGAQFARLCGIKYQTFMAWGFKRRKAGGRPALDLEPAAGGGPGTIRLFEAEWEQKAQLAVELPGGSRIVVCSPLEIQMAAEMVVLIAEPVRRC